jgi:hypothetical protein
MVMETQVNLVKVSINWEGKSYMVKVGSVKDPDKMSIDKVYATDDLEPNIVQFGQKEYSIDLGEVQSHRWLFEWIMERQFADNFKSYPGCIIYRKKKGKWLVDRAYKGVFVEEISPEDNGPFDVKLVPMNKVYKDGTGKWYSKQ